MNQAPIDPIFSSINKALYDPKEVLESEEFEILNDPAKVQEYSDAKKNIACCYNDKQQASFFPAFQPSFFLIHLHHQFSCLTEVVCLDARNRFLW
jgi:hypothetical protein